LATSCSNVGFKYHIAEGVSRDEQKAFDYLKRACDLDYSQACGWLKDQFGGARPVR
jgi:TPR repeat protein